ncbi:MAG: hypothetical protein LBS55_12090 [Prevotellaceae bacterium]|jgi:hypothetical protein|nr:hypothetical protein [Prevotellaceae bacterium]
MKKILFFTFLLFVSKIAAQDYFTLPKSDKDKLFTVNPQLFIAVGNVEYRLEVNSSILLRGVDKSTKLNEITLGAINEALGAIELKNEDKAFIERLCFNCYLESYNEQLKKLDSLLKYYDYKVDFLGATTEEQARIIADSIISVMKRVYKFHSISTLSGHPTYYGVRYFNTEKPDKYFLVEFHKAMLGANKDLEIEGTPFYIVTEINGRFLDIFPVWKKYFDNDAIQEDILKKWKHERILNVQDIRYKYRLTKEPNDLWQIYGQYP